MQRLQQFRLGLSHVISGIFFLGRSLRLWPYALFPIVINVALLALMLGTFFHFYGDLYHWLVNFLNPIDYSPSAAWYAKLIGALLWVVGLLVQLLLVVLSLILILLVSYIAGFVISSPFNDLLSEQVEVMITGEAPPPFAWGRFFRGIIPTIRIEFQKALLFLFIPLILLVFAFIPIVGTLLSPPLAMMFGMFDLGFSYIDYPQARRIRSLRERLRFARRHSFALLGFGTPILIPFANLLLMAPMVVGGTLLYLKLLRKEE